MVPVVPRGALDSGVARQPQNNRKNKGYSSNISTGHEDTNKRSSWHLNKGARVTLPKMRGTPNQVRLQATTVLIKLTKPPKVVICPDKATKNPQKGDTKYNAVKKHGMGSTKVGSRARPGSIGGESAHVALVHRAVMCTQAPFKHPPRVLSSQKGVAEP